MQDRGGVLFFSGLAASFSALDLHFMPGYVRPKEDGGSEARKGRKKNKNGGDLALFNLVLML